MSLPHFHLQSSTCCMHQLCYLLICHPTAPCRSFGPMPPCVLFPKQPIAHTITDSHGVTLHASFTPHVSHASCAPMSTRSQWHPIHLFLHDPHSDRFRNSTKGRSELARNWLSSWQYSTASSMSNDLVLNFVVFIPSTGISQAPLCILDNTSESYYFYLGLQSHRARSTHLFRLLHSSTVGRHCLVELARRDSIETSPYRSRTW